MSQLPWVGKWRLANGWRHFGKLRCARDERSMLEAGIVTRYAICALSSIPPVNLLQDDLQATIKPLSSSRSSRFFRSRARNRRRSLLRGCTLPISSTSPAIVAISSLSEAASASEHTAEIFTTGVSGLSHLKLANVNKKVFARLLIPGVLGGVLGACVLTAVPGSIVRPFVSVYLLVMGIAILRRSLQAREPKQDTRHYHLIPLGLAGGFFDAIGGGGWGPIVTTTLVAGGDDPRITIGSVNLTEFFVTLVESVTFALTIGPVHWKIILGLMIGGGWLHRWRPMSASILRAGCC